MFNPLPKSSRYQPTRCGIENLFDYGHQEFQLEKGRLLLRGKNGSGKSRGLELIFPLTLDGDIRPHALDSSGGSGKGMKFNLLGDGQYETRIGYAWSEFYLEAENRYLTAIFGAKGREGKDVNTWFALTERRVNLDLSLLDPSGRPLDKKQLKAELGTISDSRAEHAEKVNRELFGYETVEEMERHLNIQRAIRRPKLSEELNPGYVSAEIRNSFPALDRDLLSETQERLDDLEQMQQEKEDNQEIMDALLGYQKTYNTYQRRILLERATRVKEAEAKKTYAAQKLAGLKKKEAEIKEEIQKATERKKQIESESEKARALSDQLLSSKEMQDAAAIDQLDRQIAESEKRLALLKERSEQQKAQRERLNEEKIELAQKIERAEAELQEAQTESSRSAAQAGIEGHDQIARAELKAAQHGLRKLISERGEALEKRSDLEQQVEGAQLRLEQAEADLTRANRVAEIKTSGLNQARGDKESLMESLSTKLGQWLDSIQEIEITPRLREEVLDTQGEPRAAVDKVRNTGLNRITEAEVKLQREKRDATQEKDALQAELRKLQEGATPLPSRPAWRTAERDDSATPLFKSCEFTEETQEGQRGGLEGALEASGLLDALILADNAVIIQGEIGVIGGSNQGTENPYLRVDPSNSIDKETAEAVLRAIHIVEEKADRADGVCVMGLDGSWKLGPARGTYRKDKAEFIGAAGREASRQQKMQELSRQIETLEETIKTSNRGLEALSQQRDRFTQEIHAAPSDQELLKLEGRIELLEQEIASALEEIESYKCELEKTREVLLGHKHRLEVHNQEAGLNGTTEQLRLELKQYSDLVDNLIEEMRARSDLGKESEHLETRHKDVTQALEETEYELEACMRRHAEMEGQREGMETQAGGVEKVKRKLAEVRNLIGELKAEAQATAKKLNGLAGREGETSSELKSVEEKNRTADLELKEALTQFKAIEATARELLGESTSSTQEIASIAEKAELRVAGETENLINRLDKEYTALVSDLSGSAVTAVKQQIDGVYEVKILETGGGERTLSDAISRLQLEMQHAEQALSEKQRSLFRDQMVGSVAREIGRHVADSKQMIADINQSMAKAHTSAGHTMIIELKIDEDFEAEDRRALQLITEKDVDLLSPKELQVVVDFMIRRVDKAPELSLTQGERRPLSEMMDYRTWLQAGLFRRNPDGEKKKYDQKEHSRSSGGEKATAILIPMMAMLTGHLKRAAAHAPRMVLMDEAFVGIDAATQRRLISLMNEFDLDCVLTSCELWCCYPEMKGLSIYNLERDEQAHQIGYSQFVWNGRERREVEALEEQLL